MVYFVENPNRKWLITRLLGGFNRLKNISQIGSSSQLLGKRKAMFQTPNQVIS
jgi:hypothetical protein